MKLKYYASVVLHGFSTVHFNKIALNPKIRKEYFVYIHRENTLGHHISISITLKDYFDLHYATIV